MVVGSHGPAVPQSMPLPPSTPPLLEPLPDPLPELLPDPLPLPDPLLLPDPLPLPLDPLPLEVLPDPLEPLPLEPLPELALPELLLVEPLPLEVLPLDVLLPLEPLLPDPLLPELVLLPLPLLPPLLLPELPSTDASSPDPVSVKDVPPQLAASTTTDARTGGKTNKLRMTRTPPVGLPTDRVPNVPRRPMRAVPIQVRIRSPATMTEDPAPHLDEAWIAALAPPVLSPRVFQAVEPIVPRRTFGLEYARDAAMRAAYRAHERDLPRFPRLADVGLAMLARDRSVEERVQACVWLTLFPSDAMADALARVLLDDAEPAAVRDQAAWSLGFRQAQERHEALLWPASAIARANAALAEAWERGLAASLPQLAPASRHVDDARLFAWMRDHLEDAWPALEAFADEPLARAVLARIADGHVPEDDVHRAIRLAAHVLGAEAGAPLVDYARSAPAGPAHEARLAAIAAGSTAALDALDAAIATMAFPEPARAQRAAYLASGGASFHVRALGAVRVTATLGPEARRAACTAACADFALLARVDAIHESYLHAMWRHAAFGAHDAAAIVACAERSPRALTELPALGEPYVTALCEVGRFRDAARVASELGLHGHAAWETARRGRPFLALRLAAQAGGPRARTTRSAAGEALASFLVGRVDLAQAALDGFEADAQARWDGRPHPDDGDAGGGDPVARAVLDRDVVALASRCVAPPARPGADPDDVDLAWVAAAERRLRPRLEGMCVFLAGFDDAGARRAARERVEALGARVVDAPFGNVDVVVVPDERPDAPVDARLVVRSVPIVPLSRALRRAADT